MWKSFLLSALALAGACAAGRAAEPSEKLVRDLVTVFEDPKNSSEVRTTAVRALGALGWPGRENVPDLIKFLDDPGEKKLARDTLGPYLVVIDALGRLGPAARSAVPTLVKAKGIAAPYDQAVEGALENILLAPPGSAYALLGSLRDNDPAVRLLAARALRTSPVEYLLMAPLLRESAEKDPDPDVRRAAKETLTLLTRAEVNRLVQLLKDRDANVRVLAAKALGGMGADAADAVKALREAADNTKEDPDVRDVARNAIKKITAPQKP
jgi:HEAT repeat protein